MTHRRLAMAAVIVAILPIVSVAHASAARRVNHVFVIVLENESRDTTFGPDTKAPYLARTLTRQGVYLDQYYGIGHVSLDNYIAMVSGQAPNLVTQSDCGVYLDFVPPTAVPTVDGQVAGEGCVYPSGVKTVADQLATKGLRWKGYMEDMQAPCLHPVLNQRDTTQSPRPGDQYAARHDPFVYFHSIIDSPACAANVVALPLLAHDLARASTTPNLVFVTPNLCHDGHDAPCISGEPGGLVSADAFLRTWVPRITSSPAFRRDGMLVITFDEAEVGGDAAACCGEQPGPGSPLPGLTGMGGGRIGAVVLSPFVRGGTISHVAYNHYGLLRTIEDAFSLSHLGYARAAGVRSFGADVLNR